MRKVHSIFNEVVELDKQQQKVTDRLEYYNNLENYILSISEISNDIPAPVNVTIEDPNINKNICRIGRAIQTKKELRTNSNT